MIRYFSIICLCLAYTSQTYAIDWQYKLDLALGKRADQVDYAIDGLFTEDAANVQSNMQLQVDDISELQFNYRFIGDNKWYVKGFYNEGFVQDGQFKQRSYNTNNLNTPLATWQANNMQGTTSDRSFAFGRQWRWHNQYAVTPLLGYSRHYQDFQVRQGNQLSCAQGSTALCWQSNVAQVVDGTWHSNWGGPWIGVDMRYNYGHWTGVLELEHHQINYSSRLTFTGSDKPAGIDAINQTGQGSANKLALGASYWVNGGFVNMQYTMMQLNIGNTELHTQLGQNNYFATGKNNQALTRTLSIGYTSLY